MRIEKTNLLRREKKMCFFCWLPSCLVLMFQVVTGTVRAQYAQELAKRARETQRKKESNHTPIRVKNVNARFDDDDGQRQCLERNTYTHPCSSLILSTKRYRSDGVCKAISVYRHRWREAVVVCLTDLCAMYRTTSELLYSSVVDVINNYFDGFFDTFLRRFNAVSFPAFSSF